MLQPICKSESFPLSKEQRSRMLCFGVLLCVWTNVIWRLMEQTTTQSFLKRIHFFSTNTTLFSFFSFFLLTLLFLSLLFLFVFLQLAKYCRLFLFPILTIHIFSCFFVFSYTSTNIQKYLMLIRFVVEFSVACIIFPRKHSVQAFSSFSRLTGKVGSETFKTGLFLGKSYSICQIYKHFDLQYSKKKSSLRAISHQYPKSSLAK